MLPLLGVALVFCAASVAQADPYHHAYWHHGWHHAGPPLVVGLGYPSYGYGYPRPFYYPYAVGYPSYPSYVPTYVAPPAPPPTYIDENSGGYCREYSQHIRVNNQVQESYGTACLQPDGSWRVVGQR